MLSADNLCNQFGTRSGPIQTVLHSDAQADGIEKIQHPKSKIWHNNKV